MSSEDRTAVAGDSAAELREKAASDHWKGLVRAVRSSFSWRQMLIIEIEQWLGALLRPVPGSVGFVLRYLLYKVLCARLGGFCFIYTGVHVNHTYGLRIGKNLHVDPGAYLSGRGGLTIGNHVLVGKNAIIMTAKRQWTDPNLPIILQEQRLGAVTVGDDVWLGANSVVMPGIHIGTGTIIGANAVVTRDTEPYSIVAGLPARKIGERPRPDGWVERSNEPFKAEGELLGRS